MSSTDRYTYTTTVGANLTRPQLQIRDGVLYMAANLADDEGVHVVIVYSIDDGESWESVRVPDAATGPMRDPKLALINYDWWVFAHGLNDAGVDTVHMIRRTVDDGDNAQWDEGWTPLLANQQRPARVTDVLVDPDNQTVIHLAYDVRTSANRFAVHGAMVSTVTGALAHDNLITSAPAVDQHNGRLAKISGDVYALLFEQRLSSGNWAVMYTQCTWPSWSWTPVLNLSGDPTNDDGVHLSCYHPSLTVDDVGTVHVCWLMSMDDYATAWVVYTMIINSTATTPRVVSSEAADDRYPWVMVDDERSVFALFNLANDHVRYIVHRVDDGPDEWAEITNLAANTWTILNGWCADGNIYTLAVDSDGVTHFLRVDTVLAETFVPVNDLRIAWLTATHVGLEWTKARNAEEVHLQRLAADVWGTAPTLVEVGVTDDRAHVVGLPVGVRHRFRLVTKDAQHRRTVVPLNGDRWTATNEEQDELLLWTPVDGAVEAVLEYTTETWEDVQTVPATATSCTHRFTDELVNLRLRVVGGPRAGMSNFVRPLTAEVDDGSDVHLAWELREPLVSLAVEQSLDGRRWFPASTSAPVALTDVECTVTQLANVVHRFRLSWTTAEDEEAGTPAVALSSNVAVVTNCLRVVALDATWVGLGWVDVDPAETRCMQMSTDGGGSWTTVVSVVDECTMVVSGLTRCTRHLFRLMYGDRFTGRFSNVVEATTATQPVDDLTLVSVDGQAATLRCTLDASFSALTAHARDTVSGQVLDVPLDTQPVDGVLEFTLTDLPLGTYQAVSLEVTGGERAGISAETLVTIEGFGPANVQLTTVDAHTLRVSADALPGITADNVADCVQVLVTADGLAWETFTGADAQLAPSFALDIPHLRQATAYTALLVVLYGAHRGAADLLEATTDPDGFPAVHGDRLPGERSAVVANGVCWVADRDRLYTVDLATGAQALVRDLATGVHRVWTACVADSAGAVHAAFALGKHVLLLSSADPAAAPVEVYANAAANEQLHVRLLSTPDGSLVVTWEEDHGHFSHLLRTIRRGGVEVDPPRVLLSGAAGGYMVNRAPALAAMANGHALAAVADGRLRLVTALVDVDPASSTFAQELVEITEADAEGVAMEDSQACVNLAVDNLDGRRLAYSLAEGGCTFAQVVDGKYTEVLRIADVRWATPWMVDDQLLLIAELAGGVVTTRLDVGTGTFTDLEAVELERGLDGTPLTLARDALGSCWVVSTFAGRWTVQVVNLAKAAASTLTNGALIGNRRSLTTEQAVVSVWTVGDVDDHPLLFMKVNDVAREVTERDAAGRPVHPAIHVDGLEEVSAEDRAAAGVPTDSLLAVRLVSTDMGDRVLDLTEWLAFSWDRATVVNTGH